MNLIYGFVLGVGISLVGIALTPTRETWRCVMFVVGAWMCVGALWAVQS